MFRTKGFESQQFSVRDSGSLSRPREGGKLQLQAASLLTDRKETSKVFSKVQAASPVDQASLHPLELTSHDSGKNLASGPPKGGTEQISEAAAQRMSHNEAALAQTNGDQALQIMKANPTEEAMKTLVDRDRSSAVDLAVSRPEVMSMAMNSDMSGTFKDEVKQRIYGL